MHLFGEFAGRQSFHGERMNGTGKLVAQHIVNQPLAGDPAKAFESRGDNQQAEMRLAAFRRACMSGVKMGFVRNVEALRRQRRFQFFVYGI